MTPTKPTREHPESVYSNFDHVFDDDVVKLLEASPGALFARHAAWNFNGSIWFDGKIWWEEVWQYQVHVTTISSPELPLLIEEANRRYGEA